MSDPSLAQEIKTLIAAVYRGDQGAACAHDFASMLDVTWKANSNHSEIAGKANSREAARKARARFIERWRYLDPPDVSAIVQQAVELRRNQLEQVLRALDPSNYKAPLRAVS